MKFPKGNKLYEKWIEILTTRVSEANEGQKVVNIEIHFEKSLLPLGNSVFGRVF